MKKSHVILVALIVGAVLSPVLKPVFLFGGAAYGLWCYFGRERCINDPLLINQAISTTRIVCAILNIDWQQTRTSAELLNWHTTQAPQLARALRMKNLNLALCLYMVAVGDIPAESMKNDKIKALYT